VSAPSPTVPRNGGENWLSYGIADPLRSRYTGESRSPSRPPHLDSGVRQDHAGTVFTRILITFGIVLSICGVADAQSRKPAKFSELAAYLGADREQVLVSGAKQEGKVVWYTSLAGGSYKAIVDAFESKYPDVKVDVYRAPGAELAVRMTEEARGRRAIVDALETTTDTDRKSTRLNSSHSH